MHGTELLHGLFNFRSIDDCPSVSVTCGVGAAACARAALMLIIVAIGRTQGRHRSTCAKVTVRWCSSSPDDEKGVPGRYPWSDKILEHIVSGLGSQWRPGLWHTFGLAVLDCAELIQAHGLSPREADAFAPASFRLRHGTAAGGIGNAQMCRRKKGRESDLQGHGKATASDIKSKA